MKKILVVEDDLSLVAVLQPMIRKIQPQARIDWLTSAEDALEQLKKNLGAYDVVLSDISLAGEKSGLDLVEDCYNHRIPAHFVLTSGTDSLEARFPFIPKPLRLADVEDRLGPFLKTRKPPPRLELKRNDGAFNDTVDSEQAVGWFFAVLLVSVYVWMQSAH